MNQHFFQNVFESYNASLFEGADQVIASGLTAMAAIVQILGVMFVAVFGYLTLTGNLTPKTGLSMVLRIVLVQTAMTPLYFNQYVRDFMLHVLPDWIAQAVGTGNGVDAGAAQFDQLRIAIVKLSASLVERTSFTLIAERIEIFFLKMFCEIVVELSFFMWVFVRGVLALVVSVGPFIIVAYLFNATRPFVENWLGKLVGIAVLLLLISVLMKIIITQFAQFISQVDLNNLDLDAGIEGMLSILLAMIFGLGLLLYLPRIAFSIGNGAAFDPLAGATLAASALASAATKLAQTAKAGFKAAKKGAKAAGALARKMRK